MNSHADADLTPAGRTRPAGLASRRPPSRWGQCRNLIWSWCASHRFHVLVLSFAVFAFRGPLLREAREFGMRPPRAEVPLAMRYGGWSALDVPAPIKMPSLELFADPTKVPPAASLTKAIWCLGMAQKFASSAGSLALVVSQPTPGRSRALDRAQHRLRNATHSFRTHCRAAHRYLKQASPVSVPDPRLREMWPASQPETDHLPDALARFVEDLLSPAERLADACKQTASIGGRHLFELQELAEVAASWELALQLAEVAEAGRADSVDSAQFSAFREPMTDVRGQASADETTLRNPRRRGHLQYSPMALHPNPAAAEGMLDVAPPQEDRCLRHACGLGVVRLAREFRATAL